MTLSEVMMMYNLDRVLGRTPCTPATRKVQSKPLWRIAFPTNQNVAQAKHGIEINLLSIPISDAAKLQTMYQDSQISCIACGADFGDDSEIVALPQRTPNRSAPNTIYVFSYCEQCHDAAHFCATMVSFHSTTESNVHQSSNLTIYAPRQALCAAMYKKGIDMLEYHPSSLIKVGQHDIAKTKWSNGNCAERECGKVLRSCPSIRVVTIKTKTTNGVYKTFKFACCADNDECAQLVIEDMESLLKRYTTVYSKLSVKCTLWDNDKSSKSEAS